MVTSYGILNASLRKTSLSCDQRLLDPDQSCCFHRTSAWRSNRHGGPRTHGPSCFPSCLIIIVIASTPRPQKNQPVRNDSQSTGDHHRRAKFVGPYHVSMGICGHRETHKHQTSDASDSADEPQQPRESPFFLHG